jgi:DNA-binding response OmpR family regulator
VKSRILVVEDEALIAMEIADILEEGGFEVIGLCQTVSQALNWLGDPDCCDAAVLDANLHNVSSEPVALALLSLQVPFVVVSGYLRSQLPGLLAEAPLLAKPLRSNDLITQLHKLLAPQ